MRTEAAMSLSMQPTRPPVRSTGVAACALRSFRAGWVCLLVLVLVPATAVAGTPQPGVRIGSRRLVVVSAGGARALITRAPFQIEILNSQGDRVLREASPVSGPVPVSPAAQLEFGHIGPPPPTLYAPLSFLVGKQQVTQTPSGQWEGTLNSVAQTGIYYSAQSVLHVRRQGAGAVLSCPRTIQPGASCS